MKKIIFVSVCLAVFFYSNTAFCGGIEDLERASGGSIDRPSGPSGGGGSYSCDEACWQAREAREEARAEARAEAAARQAAHNKALNEASQAAESSRKNAERSAAQAQSKERELAQLRNSMIDPAKVDTANRRYQDAVRDRKELNNQLDNLQRKFGSINMQISPSDASLGTAVRLNEEDFYKKIMIRPPEWMYQQAVKNHKAQLEELDELKNQLIILSKLSETNDERISLEKQIQKKAIFGLGSDLLNVMSPVASKYGDKNLKRNYAIIKAVVDSMEAIIAPNDVEQIKKGLMAIDSTAQIIKEIELKPSLSDQNRSELEANLRAMSLLRKIFIFQIDQHDKEDNKPVWLPSELSDDLIKLNLNLGGTYNPYIKVARAMISVQERTNQYVHAGDAVKQIRRMKEGGSYAKEYIEGRILVVDRNREASERTISAYKSN